jgi:formate dehydrogenase alpha subunit
MMVPTVCIYCGTGCQLYLKVRDGKVVETVPHEAGPGEGKLCIKGWSTHEFINHPDRLTKPIIRERNTFRETGWNEALGVVADGIKKAIELYGRDSVAIISSAKCTNEENYLLQKLARATIGTNNIDHCARLCHASTITGLVSSFGSGAMTNSQEDVKDSDVIFVIGSNTSEQHPLIARRMIRAVKKGSKLIVADPRAIDLTEYAVVHLRHRPGTDVALMNAMMNVIIDEGLHDKAFIKTRTDEGFETLEETVTAYLPQHMEAVTDVPADDIRTAALLYGKAESASIFFSMGITQHTTGVDNVVSIANLAMLTGNLGRKGTGVNPLRGHNNVQGSCDMGALPDYLPGYTSVTEEATRTRFGDAWGTELPLEPGLTLMEMVDRCGDDIRAMYIMGENPLLSDPDINNVREQLGKLEFLAVSEIFLSETAEIADVVLPAASFAEKDGTFTATDRRVQRVRKAIEPVGESRSDWQIIIQLSERLGFPMEYESPREIMEEIAELTPIYRGILYPRLETGSLRWPCPDTKHPGTMILHRDKFTRGIGRFHPVEYKPPAEEPDGEYPYILTTGRLLFHLHTGTMTRRSQTLTDQINKALAEINPSDAERLKIRNGDIIKVKSRRGEIVLEALVTERIKKGVVFIPFHFAEAAANVLTNTAIDPLAKIPELKVCAVAILKV